MTCCFWGYERDCGMMGYGRGWKLGMFGLGIDVELGVSTGTTILLSTAMWDWLLGVMMTWSGQKFLCLLMTV